MKLELLSVAVRERSLAELFDLGLLLARRHAFDLMVLGAIGALPFAALNWWLFAHADPEDWSAMYWFLVLVAAEVPLATAPITAYLGEAMFSQRASRKDAVRVALARTPALALFGLWRGVMAFFPVLLLLYPPHAVEVLLLERQRLRATFKRANDLASNWRGELTSHLIASYAVLATGVALTLFATAEAVKLLFWGFGGEDGILSWLHPAHPPIHALLWPFIAYLAVVRFLAYIDLRTRREGWEVELELRRAGRRLEPANR